MDQILEAYLAFKCWDCSLDLGESSLERPAVTCHSGHWRVLRSPGPVLLLFGKAEG